MALRDSRGSAAPADACGRVPAPRPQRTGGPAAAGSSSRVGIRDRWFRSHPAVALLYRTVVGLVGAVVVVTGIVLLPLPGPGWLIIFCGLAVLATEFVWAQRLLHVARLQVARRTRWANGQPLALRVAVAGGTAFAVALAMWGYFAVAGSPTWLPVPVRALVAEYVPGIG